MNIYKDREFYFNAEELLFDLDFYMEKYPSGPQDIELTKLKTALEGFLLASRRSLFEYNNERV